MIASPMTIDEMLAIHNSEIANQASEGRLYALCSYSFFDMLVAVARPSSTWATPYRRISLRRLRGNPYRSKSNRSAAYRKAWRNN